MRKEKLLDFEIICLAEYKDLSDKKLELIMTPERELGKTFGIFRQDPNKAYGHEFDELQFTNVNKVFKRNPKFEYFEGFETQLDVLRERYFNKLVVSNRKLLAKTKSLLPSHSDVDLIVLPESSNEHLRTGLSELFLDFYNAEFKSAKKEKQIESSSLNDDDDDELKFLFEEKFHQDHYNNVVILDDCISSSRTLLKIREAINDQGISVDRYYCCVYLQDEK